MGAESKSPVALRVGQLMTGFGAGCGIGLGVGYPIALGAVPILGDLFSATSSAGSRAFGGVGQKAFGMLGKLGIKNLDAGVGCGIGIGHGFGVGIALKPGVSQQIVRSLQERLSAVASQLQKYLPLAEEGTPAATQATDNKGRPVSLLDSSVRQPPVGHKLVKESPGKTRDYVQNDANPAGNIEALTSGSTDTNDEVRDLHQENEILRMLLRHQELIDHLKWENAAIQSVLSEQFDVHIAVQKEDADLKLETAKSSSVRWRNKVFHSGHGRRYISSRDCFDCQMSARRRR